MGNRFDLRIDHYGMKHLFGQPTLNSIKTRWLDFISESGFEIKHVKDKKNKVANSLSKRAHKVHVASINMYKTNM
jgi:hypothetical protein